jgi:hypothetical protein
MLVSDSHCEGCEWFRDNGQSKSSIKDNKGKGYCPFFPCVKRYGFRNERRKNAARRKNKNNSKS